MKITLESLKGDEVITAAGTIQSKHQGKYRDNKVLYIQYTLNKSLSIVKYTSVHVRVSLSICLDGIMIEWEFYFVFYE